MLSPASSEELRRIDSLEGAQQTLDTMLRQAPSADGFVTNLNRLGLSGQESVTESFGPILASHEFYPTETEHRAFLEPVAPETAMTDMDNLLMILFTGGTAIGHMLRTKLPFYDDPRHALKHLTEEIAVQMLDSSFFFSRMSRCFADSGDLLVCPPGRVVHLEGRTFPLTLRILTSVHKEPRG